MFFETTSRLTIKAEPRPETKEDRKATSEKSNKRTKCTLNKECFI